MTTTFRDVRVARTLAETGLDQRSWNTLASRGTNTVVQTHQWHQSWLTAYGRQFEALIAVAGNGSAIAGVAPLVVEQTPQGRIGRFIGDGRADYCDFLGANKQDVVTALINGLRDTP